MIHGTHYSSTHDFSDKPKGKFLDGSEVYQQIKNKQPIMRRHQELGTAYYTGHLSKAAPTPEWCTILFSLITLLKVGAWRLWRFSRGLLFQAPCKINQSFIKVRSPHELRNQIEQCSRLVSRYCSIKLSYCWGRWLKNSGPHNTWVLCADNWKPP